MILSSLLVPTEPDEINSAETEILYKQSAYDQEKLEEAELPEESVSESAEESMNGAQESEEPEHVTASAREQLFDLTTGSGIRIVFSCGENAGLPAEAELEVIEDQLVLPGGQPPFSEFSLYPDPGERASVERSLRDSLHLNHAEPLIMADVLDIRFQENGETALPDAPLMAELYLEGLPESMASYASVLGLDGDTDGLCLAKGFAENGTAVLRFETFCPTRLAICLSAREYANWNKENRNFIVYGPEGAQVVCEAVSVDAGDLIVQEARKLVCSAEDGTCPGLWIDIHQNEYAEEADHSDAQLYALSDGVPADLISENGFTVGPFYLNHADGFAVLTQSEEPDDAAVPAELDAEAEDQPESDMGEEEPLHENTGEELALDAGEEETALNPTGEEIVSDTAVLENVNNDNEDDTHVKADEAISDPEGADTPVEDVEAVDPETDAVEDCTEQNLETGFDELRLSGSVPNGVAANVTDALERLAGLDLAALEGGQLSAEETLPSYRVLSAWELNLIRNDECWQPDEDRPLSACISNEEINADRGLQLWHIQYDQAGQPQLTRLKDFTVQENTLLFPVTGSGVYAVSCTAGFRSEAVTITGGELPEGIGASMTNVSFAASLLDGFPTQTGEETDGISTQADDAPVFDLYPSQGVSDFDDLGLSQSMTFDAQSAEDSGAAEETGTTGARYEVITAYDISLYQNASDYQPDAEHPLTISIRDEGIHEALQNMRELQLWHVHEGAAPEQIKDFVAADDTVTFRVDHLSVFAVTYTADSRRGNDTSGMPVFSAVKPHNVKISAVDSVYDGGSGTIQYTVTVEAESDLDFDGKEYPLVISDLSSGDSPALQFVSGSYTYSHKDGFELPNGAPSSQVNGSDQATAPFTGFPVTAAHIYDGDTITLTYSAKPLRGTYDKDSQQVTVQNIVTITNNDADGNPNPSNNTEDDTAGVTTETVFYTPLTREYAALDGSWAYWKVTVNPDRYTLNGGDALTLADTFDDDYPTKETKTDAGQSIDYSSVKIDTSTGSVSYDYSGNTGTYVIPDNTPVVITYRTRITAQPGEAKTFRGTAVLKDTNGEQIAGSTAGVTGEPVVIYPSASDVAGSGNYMVKLFVYADKEMQQGIEGAEFILLDANQRPLEYALGDNAGQPVTFTTGQDGYASIELHEEPGDVAIEKNTAYYLEMKQAVAGYQKDNTLYSFMITDDPNYNSGGFWAYVNGDTLKVRLYPASAGLSVSIRFSGSYALREDQKNAVSAVLQKLDENDNWEEVERHSYTDSQWGTIKFNENLYDESLGLYQNVYRVVEENENPWDLPANVHQETTYYIAKNTESSMPQKEPQEFSVNSSTDSINLVIDNRYEEPQMTIVKMDKRSGEVLPGTVFTVYRIINGQPSGDAVETYTTDENGETVIRGDDHFLSETLYGITETEVVDGYLLPQIPKWQYFYFCNDNYLEPGILANLPAGATATNLTDNGDRITIDNQPDKITVPVMKLWQGNNWPDNAEVVVGLYRSVEGVEGEEAVCNDDGTPRTVTLNSTIPYNNTAFKDLPSRDAENHSIEYSIKEESINNQDPIDAGYIQEYGISSAGVYIVRNKPATTLTVSKEWYDFEGNKVENVTLLAAQPPVTFDVYRSSTKFVDSNPDDGITDADMMNFVSTLTKVREKLSFGAKNNWSISINDLDKQDDLGNPYYYYVLETIPSFGNERYVLDETAGTVMIQNRIAPETVTLTVTKAALKDDPRPESLDRDFAFTLQLKKDDAHPIRNWQVYTDAAHPENNLVTDWNGEASFTLKPTNPAQQLTPGASITLSLPAGVTTSVTETYNAEYTVRTNATVGGDTGDDGRTFSYVTDSGTASVSLTYTNTLHVICKVVTNSGAEEPFESLSSALKYIRENSASFSAPWTIYMLEDYTIPTTDAIQVSDVESLILTTAPTGVDGGRFPFKPPESEPDRTSAIITRGGAGGSMLKNTGTLTLEKICLDGGNLTAAEDGGLVHSAGTLYLNAGTTLRNSATDGKGGAVYAEGTVNIVDGVAITGNSAPSAAALYLNGTLNMTGGSIKENSGAADGAVVVENASDVINLSGSAVIFGNTNARNKPANLYIGVDSDKTINVKGITADAHIGVSAMDGHMEIGEQFATAEYGETENLNRFVNDVYGYRGKLKDGTTTNIVWDGLTIRIKKTVDPLGANANDRFTITLSSMSIAASTYIINGTLDYSVSASRQNRPGRITLRNVKADDEITISPLPVGDYTITEEASNYAPVYTIVEAGSGVTPVELTDGKFDAENNSSITVTNTRRLANVNLTKTLDDRLKAADEAQSFDFTVKLTEADGTAVSGFTLAEGITTNAGGEASFTMSPTNSTEAVRAFKAPVGATMTVTETVNPNYKITASALTMPKEGEGAAITDADTDNPNIFTFNVTNDGADVTFANVRKMAEIELRKNLTGKVSETESFTYTVTLTRADGNPASNYTIYRDDADPSKSITTDEDGKATIIFDIGRDESTKAIRLTIPEGTKLVVAETEVKKNVGGTAQAIYTTKYSVNGAAEKTGLTATINKVSDNDHSIVFNNTRKTNTIVVKNTVNGYSGNVVPFTYTATVTDWASEEPKSEGYDDYDANDFTDGVMTFELTSGQARTLTVPYGASLTVSESFIVGYETKVKHGSSAEVMALSDSFVVTANMPSSSPLQFTNNQLIGLRIVNNTSSTLENVRVAVGKNNIYRVNSTQTGQELIGSNKTATLSVAAGETAILEIQHETSVTAEQNYTVSGTTPAVGYYYTINNEPSFHEYADPAILRVFNADSFSVTGKLRYSVSDSIVTFTEQPLVSFDANRGSWTTEMDGYHDRDGDRKVYQKAVNSGETVAAPTPDPVYPTAENIPFLGWTTDKTFAEQAHTESEDISANLYDFANTLVTTPFTLYAIWARDPSVRTVTVKNGLITNLTVTVTLTNADPTGANYTLYEDTSDPANSITTDENGTASFSLAANEAKNLRVPNGAMLAISGFAGIAYSTDFTDDGSTAGSFTINSVDTDGTVSFIGGIFKITDASGNLLYDASGKPAVYGNLRKINNADPDEAFDACEKTLYTDAAHTTTAEPAAVKQLVDEYTIPNTAAIAFPNKTMTLTTAGKNDTDFPYVGIRDRGTIYRSAAGAGNNCFTLASGNITLTDIILDGGSEQGVKIAKTTNGGLIYMNNASGVLNVETGTTMRNCEFAAYDNANNSRGGAIYANNGAIIVSAGLFSNLHARHGGAICAEDQAVLSVTGQNGSTVFEDCSTSASDGTNNAGDGGAIYYNNKNASKHLIINGGTPDSNNPDAFIPGIYFTRCWAGSNWGDGGAIYANTNKVNDVTVTGCSFTECSARNTTGKNDDGFGGGGIGVQDILHLTVSHCSFTSCDSLKGGAGVLARVKNNTEDNSTVSISNCSFLNCSCKAQGGGVAAYTDNNGATSSKTKLSIVNCSFKNCSSGTDNGSGGAIQCYLPCMVFSGSSFTDCWAGKEGGAVNNYFGGSYTQEWPKSSMTVDNCSFIRCRAEDRYDPTAVQHYGGGINTKVKTVTVTDSYFEDCVSTLKEGGALHIGGQGGGSTATITGSTFKNCTAKNGGGAVLSSHETLTIENSNFYGCGSSASNGGAVYHYQNSRGGSTQKNLTIRNSTFGVDPNDDKSLGCIASGNGGAIWARATTSITLEGLTINNCTAKNGGGIYLTDTAAAAKITGGSITGCEAVSGSAVYVGKMATFSGNLNVSGNTVSGADSGAIQTVNSGKLYFEGDVKVENNTCSADSVYDHDVLMQKDNVDMIYTTFNGLGVGANIGVYVPEGTKDKRALEGQAFGTYDSSTNVGSNYLESFFNDRDSELFGYQLTASDTKIYWGIYVCKITDAEGNTLKRPNGRDAVYQRLSIAFDEFTQVKTSAGEADKAAYIKMLLENYTLRQGTEISNFPAADITLTTASRSDGTHPYRGTEGTVCTISRTSGTTQLFKLDNAGATFQLEDITLDGRNDKTTETGNRRLIEAAQGTLVINGGTTLQYGAASNGGAIEAANAARVTINGVYDVDTKEPTVRFINCTGTGNSKPNGGAIRAYNLNISNSSDSSGEFGTAFINCSAYNGGAITSLGSNMEINGVFFDSCHTQSAGGAIYHNKSDNNTSTTVKNCAFENCLTNGNNWAHGGAIEARTANLSVEDCSFKDCQAASDGGAVYHGYVDGNNKPSGNREKTSIKNTTFNGCSTTGSDASYNFGGSVYTQAKTVEVIDSSFNDSTAANHGGALYCQSSVNGSEAVISGTSFDNCSTSRSVGSGGAICSYTKALTLQKSAKAETSVNNCKAPGFSGAVYMATDGSVLNITDSTVISACYADKGGAIYLKSGITMNLSDSPEFSQNGYTTQNGSVVNASEGACIYLEEGSKIKLKDSPKFSRNILPNLDRITNGGVTDFVRQDIYIAGYSSSRPFDTNAASVYVVGELTGDTIWAWPEQSPHRLPNEQFAKIADGVTVTPDSLSKLRNALADTVTNCSNGEYLAGVQVGTDAANVYWDKMYVVSFMKKDNKGITVPGAEFTFYTDPACMIPVATAKSADGENDTDAQGTLLARGMVEFTSVRIGAYFMKETKVPSSFKENNTTYLVLVGTPYLAPNNNNRYLWENGGPLDVNGAPTLVQHHTTDAGKYYGIFPLDANGKAVLRANLASSNMGIENIRNDYQAAFMKKDDKGDPLPGAAFTIYTAILDNNGQPCTYEDGYPELMRWSRDGETYPAPVVSADGTDSFKDRENKTLPKGLVYFRELPLGTYYLLETAYPERNGSGRRTFYAESDRVFKLDIAEDVNTPGGTVVTLSEWKQDAQGNAGYEVLTREGEYYIVSNREVVCKLTDESDNLLYVQGHKVRDKKGAEANTRLFPAVYPTLEEGFEAAQKESFVYENGEEANVDALELKVLKDFTISSPIRYSSSRDITFTTAEREVLKDRYVFSTTRTTDTSRALIRRAYNENTSEDANAGALITLASGADMTMKDIRLDGQKNAFNGRAIHVTEQSSLTVLDDVLIENFRQEASAESTDAHNVQGGAVLLEDGTSLIIDGGYKRTAVFSANEVMNRRKEGSTESDGGAIAVGANCTFEITDAQFNGNHASAAAEKKGNGGAVSIDKTKEATGSQNLQFYNVVFSNNTASCKGGAIRTAEKCNLTVSNCIFDSNAASGSGSEGGAIAVLSSEEAPSALTVIDGTVFTGNTAESGGAVHAENYASVALTDGSLTSNFADLGSAVYAADYAEVTATNISITDNKAGGTDGGAINVGGKNARLYFGGSPTVFDNFSANDALQQKNLILSEDYNDVINTTAEGLAEGVIGVYVTGTASGSSTVFEEHGLPGKPFGTFRDTGRMNPRVFRSDHALALYGVRNEDDPDDDLIYWVDVICKLTDESDNILYQDISLTINGKKETRKGQAVYARITAPDDPKLIETGFNALRDGFEAAQGMQTTQNKLYSRNDSSYSTLLNSRTVKLKMLKDYELDKSIVHSGGTRSVIFTTAELASDLTQDMKANGDFFPYRGSRTDAGGNPETRAQISRAFNDTAMIEASGKDLRVADIVLDGVKDRCSASGNGGIVLVQSGGSLTVTNGAALQNSLTTGSGGAVYVAADGTMTISGGTITGNTAGVSGGAVYVAENGSAAVTGGTLNGNTAANGAGIYLAWSNADNHAVLKLSGNPNFGGTDRRDSSGNDKDSLMGTEGNFILRDAGFKTDTDTEPTNGSKAYPKRGESYLVRQDICIPGTAAPHSAICVTDSITSGDGTIWVWAEDNNEGQNHYEMLKQFARFTENGAALSDAVKESSMKAFRNAQPDSKTNCGGDYLSGQRGEETDWIYWTGGFDVVFLKTDAYGEALPGATFTLYTDKACNTPYVMTFTSGDGVTSKSDSSTSSDGTATYKDKNGNNVTLEKGEVLLSKVPPKTFYLKETTPPSGYDRDENKATVYQVDISAAGELTMHKKGASGAYDTEVLKEKRKVTVNGSTTDLIRYVVMNIPEAERKVILRKVNGAYTSLQGAQFQIFRYDGTQVTSGGATTFTSKANGVYFIDKLPFGTYYLHETMPPAGYTGDKWFILTVSDDHAADSRDGVVISGPLDKDPRT